MPDAAPVSTEVSAATRALLSDLRDAALSMCPVFPLPCLPLPHRPVSSSSRLRKRHRQKMGVWRRTNQLIALCNRLDSGTCRQQTASRKISDPDQRTLAAWERTHKFDA